LDESEFYKRPDGSLVGYCKKCHNEVILEAKRKRKKKAIDYKGGKCSVCEYDKCDGALEFHHLDPTKKEFKISSSKKLGFKKIQKELDKCVLLCANCHRETHHSAYG